jgi:hypothetical protein
LQFRARFVEVKRLGEMRVHARRQRAVGVGLEIVRR